MLIRRELHDHIFKLLVLWFGFIMMFDTTMFSLSFDTDYIG